MKLRYTILPLLLIIACLGIAACTGEQTATTSTPTTTTPAQTTMTPPPTTATTTQTQTTSTPEYTHKILTIGGLVINEYTDKLPGQSTILPRAYPGAPPFIPHSLSGLVINKSANSCLTCHATGLSYGPDHTATIIPESHYTDILTGTLSEDIQGTRYNCLLCHVPQSPENPPLE